MSNPNEREIIARMRTAILSMAAAEAGKRGELEFDEFFPILRGLSQGYALLLGTLNRSGRALVLKQIESEARNHHKRAKAMGAAVQNRRAETAIQPEKKERTDAV